ALFTTAPPALARADALDCPDWLLPLFDAALGERADPVLALMRERAPVFLRVNAARGTLAGAQAELSAEGIGTRPHSLAAQALEVISHPRRIRNSAAYREGRVELQDAASQAVIEALVPHVASGGAVLDYCAGGGGKALALAAHGLAVSAHDAAPQRMRDLPERARRAGARITVLPATARGQWPVVLADVPCSGSGSWRRAPEAKWALTPERLRDLTVTQAAILHDCAARTAPGGLLAYATCSLFLPENDEQIVAFLARTHGFRALTSHHFTPLDGGDGFYLAILRRD
ncbi:MAG TPA: RsmB/NOP family class I SAM-dependent RNA methyltransferase, partial [Paracoccus sp.]|nr:RsmB/NOP family class I SAM-dependent RNA methyltransferase [Paracoccus sp. (in: a-proteobacteria)]